MPWKVQKSSGRATFSPPLVFCAVPVSENLNDRVVQAILKKEAKEAGVAIRNVWNGTLNPISS